MFVSHHTLKWTRTCRSHGRHPHAHTAHFLLNRHKGGQGGALAKPAGRVHLSDPLHRFRCRRWPAEHRLTFWPVLGRTRGPTPLGKPSGLSQAKTHRSTATPRLAGFPFYQRISAHIESPFTKVGISRFPRFPLPDTAWQLLLLSGASASRRRSFLFGLL